MTRKKQLILFGLFYLILCLRTFGQSNDAVIDLRPLFNSPSKSISHTSSTIHKKLISQIQKEGRLTLIDTEGINLSFELKEVVVQGPAEVQLLSGFSSLVDFLSNEKERYFISDKSNSEEDAIFLTVSSDNVAGNWKSKEGIVKFDLKKDGAHYYKKESTELVSAKQNKRCAIQNHNHHSYKQSNLKHLNTPKSLELGVVLDYSYLSSAGGIQEAVSKVKSVLALSSEDFNQEFISSVDFVINDIVLSDCATCDPWTTSTKSSEVQIDIRDWVQNNERLSSNDIVLFWSDRNYDNNILGSAQTNSVCTPYNTVILKDKSDLLWELRVIASHEIGHALGSAHDAEFSSTIMNPTLTNSTTWSPSSIQSINEGLNAASCLNSIESTCSRVSEIEISIIDFRKIKINFERGDADSVILNYYSNNYNIVDSAFALAEGIREVELDYNPCMDYKFEFISFCNDDVYSKEVLWNSKIENDIVVQYVTPANCRIVNGVPKYDLIVDILSSDSMSILMQYKGLEQDFIIYEGLHTYVIPEIPTTGMQEVAFRLVDVESGNYNCYEVIYIDEPSTACAFQYLETFDNCDLPKGWSTYGSNENANELYQWDIAGTERDIQNYGNAGNAQTTKTIDGSCMAILDDDLINQSDYTGIAYIESPVFNLNEYDSVVLSFDLIFDEFSEKGSSSSTLFVEVFGNNKWHDIGSYTENQCAWYDIWSPLCTDHIVIDISNYRSTKSVIRWQYNDGSNGAWGGMAAIDNIKVEAKKKLSLPCNQNDIYVTESPVENIESSGSMLYLSTMIDIPSANFNVTEGAIFRAGAAVNPGVTLNVEIGDCEN